MWYINAHCGGSAAILPILASSKDIRGVHYRLLQWVWKLYTWRMTPAGRWLVWPCVGFFAYTSASVKYHAFVPLSYVAGLWLLALLFSMLWRPRVRIEIKRPERVCAGEVIPVEVHVQQVGTVLPGLDLFVLPHRLPPTIDALPAEGVPLPTLKAGQSHRVELALSCKARGSQQLMGYRVETDFPFGIFRSYTVFNTDKPLLVYPKFDHLRHLEMPVGRRYQPGGVALASIVGDSMEYVGNREYREGDNVRDIDWKATARLNRPVIREYREEYFLRVAVILDTHVPPSGPVEERRAAFEDAVSVSATIGDYLARQEYIVDIFAAGPNIYHLVAGRSLAYLEQILDILACVNENPAESFAELEPEVMENLTRISTVICVFLDWTESRRKFVQNMQQQGTGLKVLIVRDAPCTLDPRGEGSLDVKILTRAQVKAGIREL
jgi:uncharacterized protein (DUF58 family)